MHDSRKAHYLNALEIVAWRPRTHQAPPQEDVTSAALAAKDHPTDERGAGQLDWKNLKSAVQHCHRCKLAEQRTQTVFGVGDPHADLLIVGEAPGQEEDNKGEPFVGRAGQLLDRMLAAIGLTRDQTFIANIIKCRPPGNRNPAADEITACCPYLKRQIELIEPKLILAVGRISAHQLLQTDEPIGRLRNRSFTLENSDIPVVVSYHPAYLLRSPVEKRKAWDDFLRVKDLLKA